MEYQPTKEELNPDDGDDDSFDWNPDILLRNARTMLTLKEAIHRKAGTNIKRAQEKDKCYYDKKHADPKV